MKKLIENTKTFAKTVASLTNYRNWFHRSYFEIDLSGIGLDLEKELTFMPQ